MPNDAILAGAKQCKAIGKRNGKRCKNPAVIGYDVCTIIFMVE